MGVAVSIQSCSEFLPSAVLGFVAFAYQGAPLLAAALFAAGSFFILRLRKCKELKKVEEEYNSFTF